MMTLSHFIAFSVLVVVLPIATTLAIYSKLARDVIMFLLVTGTMFGNHMDVHFISREWYHGTTNGLEVSLLDVFAISLITSLIIRPNKGTQRIFWPAGLAPMLLFLIYAAFTVLISEPKLFGFFELTKILRGIIVFVAAAYYVRGERELRVLLVAMACVVLYEGLFGLKLRYLNHQYRVTGTMPHENSLSMYICVVGPVLLAAGFSNLPRWLRRFCFAGAAMTVVIAILTISRMGVVTCPVVMLGTLVCVMPYRPTLKGVVIGTVVAALVIGAGSYAFPTIIKRFNDEPIGSEYTEASNEGKGRGSYLVLAKIIVDDRPLGVGLNNWSYEVTDKYGIQMGLRYQPYINTYELPDQTPAPGQDGAQAAPAHSLGALTLGELGWPGLALFTLVWGRWFSLGGRFIWPRSTDPMKRVGVGIFFGAGAIFLQSLTEWAYRQTQIMFLFHLLLGTAAGLCYVHWQTRKNRRRETAAAARQRNIQPTAV
ncbi:MAG: hypothetical protein JWR19_938 [Pedosphaera sp.]|nr:hypothetical protein [Pedosphaera sp.]